MSFPGWQIRPEEKALWVRGQRAEVGGRAFAVLLALVRARGELVTKQQLLDLAWPGLVVEENNVSVQIAALRKLLGPQVIATVAGLGYQLCAAPVEPEPELAPAPRETTDARRPASPAIPTLLGRDEDVESVAERLASAALVSIIGTGGVGKTSLARAVISAHACKSGASTSHWIDLAPLRDGTRLVPLLAKSFAIELEADALPALIAALAPLQALLVLDNCEHLIAEVAGLLHPLLAAAPGLRCLCTSQEPLRLADELVYRLEPLGVPAPDATLGEAKACAAVELLCLRATAADRHFLLDGSNLPLVIDLCRQLDGLPLAIEMAAARVGSLGLDAVHEQLDQRLRMLAGPRGAPARHLTLRSTFDWSYELLSPAEQKVFRRLEPFLGGFGAQMARQVTRDPDDAPDGLNEWQAVDVLAALVDKSLVQRSSESPKRFFMYESARQYAASRLALAGETQALRRRHAHVVAAGFDTAQADFARMRDEQWAAKYAPERHNVRAALTWACEAREPDLVAGLVAALAQLDLFVHEPAELVQCAVPMDVLSDALPSLRALACLEFSWAHYADGSREVATDLAQRALRDYNAIDDNTGRYRALAQLIRLYDSRPGLEAETAKAWEQFRQIEDRAVPLRTRLTYTIMADLPYGPECRLTRYQELEALAQRSGFEALAAICRAHISDELLTQGRFEEALAATRDYLAVGEIRPRVRSMILNNQAFALVQLNRVAEAYEPALAALRAYPGAVHIAADIFSLAAARQGRFVDAALMTGYGVSVRRERDKQPDPVEAAAIAETRERLEKALAPARLAQLMRDGAAMPVTQLLAMAVPLDSDLIVLPKAARPSAAGDRWS